MTSIAELEKQGYKIRVSHKRPLDSFVSEMLTWAQWGDIVRVPDVFQDDPHMFYTRWDLMRQGYAREQYGSLVSSTGGVTTAAILSPRGDEVASSIAYCRLDEAFCKRLGRTIAINRALNQLEEIDQLLDGEGPH